MHRRIGLVNLHSDNFGDYLNVRATHRFVTEALDGEVVYGLFGGRDWETIPPSMQDLPLHNPSIRLNGARGDVGRHLLARDHACDNEDVWSDLARLIDSVDAVISVPCGANVGPYRHYQFLMPFIAAEQQGTPSGMYFGTVHPSGSPLYDRLALRALRSSVVAVRDTKSVDYLAATGRDVIGGFDPTLHEAALTLGAAPRTQRNVVSVVLGESMAWHPDRLVSSRGDARTSLRFRVLSAAVRALAATSTRIELIPHTPLAYERHELRSLVGLLDRAADVCIRDDIGDVESYVEALGTSAFVVSLRYHGVISALATGTPVVAVAYEPKSAALMGTMGLERFLVDGRVATEAELTRVVRSCHREAETLRPLVHDRGSAYRAASQRRVDAFRGQFRSAVDARDRTDLAPEPGSLDHWAASIGVESIAARDSLRRALATSDHFPVPQLRSMRRRLRSDGVVDDLENESLDEEPIRA